MSQLWEEGPQKSHKCVTKFLIKKLIGIFSQIIPTSSTLKCWRIYSIVNMPSLSSGLFPSLSPHSVSPKSSLLEPGLCWRAVPQGHRVKKNRGEMPERNCLVPGSVYLPQLTLSCWHHAPGGSHGWVMWAKREMNEELLRVVEPEVSWREYSWSKGMTSNQLQMDEAPK